MCTQRFTLGDASVTRRTHVAMQVQIPGLAALRHTGRIECCLSPRVDRREGRRGRRGDGSGEAVSGAVRRSGPGPGEQPCVEPEYADGVRSRVTDTPSRVRPTSGHRGEGSTRTSIRLVRTYYVVL